MISSIVLGVFKSRYQDDSPLYPPRMIQIEVGNTPDQFHYKSRIFAVRNDTDAEQEFSLWPDVVVGEYIKVNMIGKPRI